MENLYRSVVAMVESGTSVEVLRDAGEVLLPHRPPAALRPVDVQLILVLAAGSTHDLEPALQLRPQRRPGEAVAGAIVGLGLRRGGVEEIRRAGRNWQRLDV